MYSTGDEALGCKSFHGIDREKNLLMWTFHLLKAQNVEQFAFLRQRSSLVQLFGYKTSMHRHIS